jgi:hypothetical protein
MARSPKLHGFFDSSASYRLLEPSGPLHALEDEARAIIQSLAIIDPIAS